MARPRSFSPEVQDRSLRLVLEQADKHRAQWAAIESVASKIGCTAETLRKWVRQAECDQGVRTGLTSSERERLEQLERENRELKRSNEILRRASAFFAQAELDRKAKSPGAASAPQVSRIPVASCPGATYTDGERRTPCP